MLSMQVVSAKKQPFQLQYFLLEEAMSILSADESQVQCKARADPINVMQ